MKKGVSLAGRIILSVLLIVFVVGFVVLFSLSQHLNEERFTDLLTNVGTDIAEHEIAERSGGQEINAAVIYAQLSVDCEGQESVFLQDSDISVSCSEIAAAGEAGIEDLLRGVIHERVQQEISVEIEKIPILGYVAVFGILAIVVGVLAVCVIIVIVLLSPTIPNTLVDLGIVGLISGLPFIPITLLRVNPGALPSETVGLAIRALFGSLFFMFLIVFVVGAVLLFSGIVWNIIRLGKTART